MKTLFYSSILLSLLLCGCPADTTSVPNYMADVIPITSDMSPCEKAIVGDLNKVRDTRGSTYSGDRRDALLTAWAILKTGGPVVINPQIEEEE